jgi:hypothetical protein
VKTKQQDNWKNPFPEFIVKRLDFRDGAFEAEVSHPLYSERYCGGFHGRGVNPTKAVENAVLNFKNEMLETIKKQISFSQDLLDKFNKIFSETKISSQKRKK